MNLYELEISYRNLQDVIDNTEDESLVELITKSMDEIEDSFEKKVENIIKYSKNLRADAKAIKEEADHLTKRYKGLTKKAEHLENYLFDAMKFANKDMVKAGIFEAKIKKNPLSVKITDEDVIPFNFLKMKTEIDKVAIKEALKNGETVLGAELEQKEVLKVK